MADTITAESLAARYREQVEAIRAGIYTHSASEKRKPQPTTPREWAMLRCALIRSGYGRWPTPRTLASVDLI